MSTIILSLHAKAVWLFCLYLSRVQRTEENLKFTRQLYIACSIALQAISKRIYISLNTAANPPEGRIAISALSALVTVIFTLLYPR